MHRRHVVPLAVVAFLVAAIPFVRGQEKLYRPELTAKYLEESLRTDWYGVYLKDKKVGYVRTERKRVGDRYVEEQIMTMKLVSFGKKVEIAVTQRMDFADKAPYALVSAQLIEKSGPIQKTTTVTKTKEGYEAVHQAGGEKRTELLKGV